MGSVQQISIGLICLFAAFAFGSYVNTHPPGGHTKDTALFGADSAQPDGNVQSRFTNGIELIKKQPAPIKTMRNRLQPRFSMPSTNSTPEINSGADPNPLPPPSRLARIESSNQTGLETPTPTTMDELASSGLTPRAAKASDVPDFSSIMNELADTPIRLQPLGSMPQHSSSIDNRAAQAIAKPRHNANAPLKNLASEFKMGTLPNENERANPWNTQHKPEFSEDDFAPQLQDRYSNNASKPANQSAVETTDNITTIAAEPQSSANQVGRSNHVVSREPIPPESSGRQLDSDSSADVAGIETIRDSSPRLAQDSISRTARPKLPFALNDQGKQQLAAIKSRASSQLTLNTTKFVDHVVQPGETLQLISKRYFGEPDFYLDIYLANRNKLRNPVHIESGTALRIPVYQ